MEGTSRGNYDQEVFSTSEKTCRKRKHVQLTPNTNFKKICGPETSANENYVSPPTANAVSPLHHESTFQYVNNFNGANGYGIIPQYQLYPLPQWSDMRVPQRMCPSLPQADYFEPSTSANNVQALALPENQPLYGMPPGLPYPYPNNVKAIITLSNTILYPPDPNFEIKRWRDKPPGCRTVFVGGLPEKITEAIVREAFNMCGKIVTVRMNTKNFCHIRFSCQDEVEQAFILSGYIMKIENKDEKPYCKQLHVDYAVVKDDQHEAECAVLRRARHHARKEQEARVPPLSEVELQKLLAQFRNNNFKDGIHTLNSWLLRGEVKKENASTFFTIIQSLNHNIKRLLPEKEKQETGNTKALILHKQKLSEMSLLFGEFDKIFRQAEKPKNWINLQRYQHHIKIWKKLASEIKKLNFEQLVGERNEDDMLLSDEEDSVNDTLAKVEEPKLLQNQISEAESGITSLEENISAVRKEKDGALEALSRNLASHNSKLKALQVNYEELLARKKKLIATTTKENPVTKPVSPGSVEGFLKDACLLSLICQFLMVHPFGVNINYICSYLDKIISPVSSTAYVTNLMRRYPAVFKESISGIGATLDRKWSILRL